MLSCSDSRVPPEMVFDQGLGDIYVVRRALSCRQWASLPERKQICLLEAV